MKILITGGAGFIGSHLVDKLMRTNNELVVLDNLSSGRKENIGKYFRNKKFKLHKVDLLNDDITKYFSGVDEIWHFAANPIVRITSENTDLHVKQGILVTYKILEAMKKNDVKRIMFASSSTVYGEAKIPTPESHTTLPISLYGASKLSCEAIISAYCHTFGFQAWIFRFANVIGPRLSHGIIFDFVNKLKKNEKELEILGDGNQKKSYIFVNDCIEAMLLLKNKSNEKINVFNVGSEDWITVKEIAKIVCDKTNLNPKFKFTGTDRGWKGDIPLMLLDISKLKKLGFKPKHNSKEAVIKTVESILEQNA